MMGSGWSIETTLESAAGGNPYTRTRKGIAGVGSFAVGEACTRMYDGTPPSLSGAAYTGTTGTDACFAGAAAAAPFVAADAIQGYSDNCAGEQ